ncbi:C6 transcription factor [Stagonosporopsis vannaccii]|nr:C6 transcription factor [Stagonosporopsis vannaccii]
MSSSLRTPRVVNGSRRSKYVSKACEPCRQRRAKCDGQKPACSPCVNKSIDCQYSVASDGRKPASKSYVQLLRDRIEMLECILRKHSIDIDNAIAQYRIEHQGSSGTDTQDSNPPAAQFEEICAAFEGTLSLDESINFDADGECHYFGPTSGRLHFQALQNASCDDHILPHNSRCMVKGNTKTSRLPSARPKPSGLRIDADLQAELIDLYFIWQNPWFPVLDESLFRKDLIKGNGRYLSPLLLSCVLSAGSRFSDRPEVRTDQQDPNTAGDQLLEEAEALLHYDLLSPSLTTIQAVAIMVYLYVSRAADAVAWLHQGTAHRLALDMGLNIDAASVLGSKDIPPEEVDLRRQIYWSLYCTDKLHATYSGRVCTMLDVQGAVNFPCLEQADKSVDVSIHRSQRTKSLLRSHAAQSQILEKILLGFYAPQPSHTGSRREPFFNTTLVELKNWLYDLSDDLRLETRGQPNTFPQAYTLHMTLHTALILLGNGFLASSAHSTSPKTSELHALDKKASCVCYEAATNVCIAAKKYRNTFGNFHKSPISATHCLLSAALVLLQVASNESEASVKRAAIANVDVSLQCLDELSVSWKIAECIHYNLTLLKAQKLGAQSSDEQGQATTFVATPAWNTDHRYEAGPLDATDLLGFDPNDAVLLDDAHSFLGSDNKNDYTFEGFDFAAQLADVGMQDSFLWSNFGTELLLGPGPK